MKFSNTRIVLMIFSVCVLASIYVFQRFNYAEVLSTLFSEGSLSPNTEFILNRIIRLVINDLSVILIIYVLFSDSGLLKIAFAIQLFELFIILPIYFYIKLSIEGPSEISSPLLSFIHRIVVNPIIMLLLIPAYWFQKRQV